MKISNFLSKWLLVSLVLLALGVGNAWGTDPTSTLTFTAACGGTGTADDGVSWTVTSDAAESNYEDARGIHYGTGKVAISYLTLSTDKISGTITSIVVNAAGAKGTSASLAVTVGGANFRHNSSNSVSITKDAASYTFSGSGSGTIIVSLTQSSEKCALYCKSITVTYSVAACSADPSIGTASLNGTFNLSSVGVQCASSGAGDNCSITEYGWVWSDGATNTNPVIGGSGVTNLPKTTGAPAGSGGSFTGTLSGTFTAGHTYYYKAYVTNGKPATIYSTVQSFTPYQITYNKNNAGAAGSITPQVVNTGGNVTLASSGFSLTGHHIDHWALNSAGGTSYNKGATYSDITANAEFYAIWAVNQWTLTWAFAGGSSSETAGEDYTAGGTVNYGSAITKPSNGSMSKTGYDFSGWSSSATTMPDNNLTITAQWTAQKYAITYKDQGGGDFSGTQTSAPSQHTYGSTTTLKIPTKTGYTFGGWFTELDCASGAVGNTTSASLGATAYTSAITLYAKWTANTYQVVFNKNGGSGSAMSNQDFTYDAAPQALSSNTYTAPAHKYFIGWNTSSGASTALYTDGQSVSNLTATANGTVTLYAIWKDHTYTNYRTTCSETYDIVLHDNNGGSHNGSAKVADGGKLLTNIVAPTRDGYSVEGYYAEVGTTTKIAAVAGALQSNVTGYTDATGAWTKGDGATLYAKWTATNYTITYDGLEGASNTNPTSYTIETATIVLTNPGSREGYTFAGWTCGGTPITQITVGSTGDKTITATWTANTYSVRFNANGGGGSMSPQNFTYGVAQNLTSNGFTAPDDKSFGGWTTNSDGTGDFYTNGQEVSNLTSVNGATVDLYAKWVDCDLYTVTLNVNGDTWKTWTQGSCGASIDLSDYQGVPSCDAKYTLVGWSTTNSATPMFDAPTITKTSSYTPEDDVTLYAVYSYSAKIGTKIMNTTTLENTLNPVLVVASGYDYAMQIPASNTNLGNGTAVIKSGNKCIVTGSNPGEFGFWKKSSVWLAYYVAADYNYMYFYAQNKNPLGCYSTTDYGEWYYYDDDDIISVYDGVYYGIDDYLVANEPTAIWSISIDGTSGEATISGSDGSNTRYWKYNSGDVKFGAYTSNKAICLYEYANGTAYTTQPSMTVYSITKGAETNGTYTISAGVVCSGGSVSLTATPDPGYAFNEWSSSNGGNFGDASSASTTYTIGSSNTTLTASFVAAAPHDITWMVNGSTYIVGDPTSSLTAGTSFSTMTLPTAPANNTLSSACGAVANTFVGWSTTDMGFATGQSAPAKLFTTATGAGSAYGNMGDEDVVFYAVFAQDGSSNYMSRCANTYNITLDDNGDYGGNGSATATEKGTSLTINSTPTRLGYSVEGYYKEVGTTTKVATDAGALQNGSGSGIDGWTNSGSQFIGTSDGTLYTKWNIVTYNLTYENLNGASNSNPATYQVTTATIVLADPSSRTGYTFAGWTCGGDAITQIALGSTGDKTITANWTANKYNITYKDKDDAAYSGDKTDGRPTGLPAQHTYGSATELNDGTRTGYRFDGWYTSSNCSTGKVTSLGATDYTSAITLYAKWTASHTYSFSKNGVVDGTLQKGAVEGETVTMPNTTVDCGLWTTFVGWVEGDVAETTTEPATIYRAGDIYEVPLSSGDKTFKAVYSKHEGDASVYYEKVTSGPKSGTYVMVSYPRNDIYYIYTSYNASSYCNQSPVTISDNGTVSAANATSVSAREVTVRAGNGANTGKFAIYDGTVSKYLTGGDGSVGVNNDITFCWNLMDGSTKVNSKDQIPKAGAIHSTTNTTYLLQLRNHSTCDRFQMYANTQTDGTNPYDVYLYRKRVAGTTYYATAPSCSVPTEITVSYNDNKANAGDQTISGMPSGTTLDFITYPDFASYTIGAAPTDPTGYHFTGWNTSVDGNGDSYTAGSSVTTFGYTETITLYAQWERVYTVTLMDNGVERTRLTEASAGAGVMLPSGNNCTPSSTFTFVGWTESAVQLNADPVRPATLHAAGSYTPTSDITLYSVYSKSVAGCDDFAAGVSGAYKMYYDGSKYATTAGGSGNYTGATSGTAEVFYIAYAPSHTGYTISTSAGYLGWNYDGGELTKGNTTPYYWKISGSSSNWVITPEPSAYTKQLKSSDGSKFQLYAAATGGKLLLQKSAMTYYYNTAVCGDNSITFHDGGGTISGTPTMPDGASWNSGTSVLSGLEDCDKITTFPTASYDGWTFIGWSTEDYSNSGKHTAGTDQYGVENASTDEPDGSILFKTGGNSYTVRGGSIDLYPVFTRFPDNEPFDLESGGDFYIYYLKSETDDGYGNPVRVYATGHDGSRYLTTTSCASATEFTFTKDGEIWHIYDKNARKYIAGVNGNDDLSHASNLDGSYDDWTITIKSGNQFYASCQGGGRYISFSTSANHFMDYSIIASPGLYPPVYLGSCEERIFSSEPYPKPTIDLTGEPMVTSSIGQTVRAATPLTLSGSHLAGATKVTLTGTNLKFATSTTAAPVASLEVAVTSGNVAATNIYVYYTPTATEDGIENVIITATDDGDSPVTKKASVQVRHLPADFVIAAKIGDKWYALPADINSSSANTTGVLIEVDNAGDPTAATAAPMNTKWGLRNVKTTRQTTNGLGDYLTFTERETATADNQKTLYNGSGTNIQTNAQWSNYAATNPEKYEWIPTTADFKDYILTSAAETRTLSLNTSGVFGSLTQSKAYDGKVRLLPASFYESAEMQVVEWKASSVVVMYTGSGTTATTKVGTGSESSAQSLSSAKVDHGVFELTTGTLTGNANKVLTVTIKNGSSAFVGKTMLTIPAIVSGSTTAPMGIDAAATPATDVVVLDGATLSAVATKYTFKNITVYPGGKLVIGSDKQLGMASLTLRGGSGWGAAEYEYKYPQFVVNNATDGAYSNTSGEINYDYVTTKDQYYSFVLPYASNTKNIKYPLDIYGSAVSASNTGSFEFQYYDGAARAAGGTGWKVLEEDPSTGADLVAGKGYTFLGMPKKVDAYDGSDSEHANTRQRYGIHRIPMSVAASAVQSGETTDKNITIDVTLATKNNNSGWNLIGNPYMSNVSGLSNTDIQVGELVPVNDAGGNWTGRWQWDSESVTENQRFVVIPSNSGLTYESELASDATLHAFKNFFVQIQNEEANALVIPANSRTDKLLAPARYTDEAEQDIRLAVDLVSEARKDKVDLLINDIYSAAFDHNGDFTKMLNSTNFNLYGVYPDDYLSFIAVDKTTAANSIAVGFQVPAGGDYTLQLSDRAYVMTDAVETLYVTDHEVSPEITTDLLDSPYNFHVNNAETNNTRFTVSIRLAPMTPTDIGNVPDDGMGIDNAKPQKFIYHDKLYILRNGVIYDATGKEVKGGLK